MTFLFLKRSLRSPVIQLYNSMIYRQCHLKDTVVLNEGCAVSVRGADISSTTWRTHFCGELRSSDVGARVVLCGWMQYNRGNHFLVLRDCRGRVQVMLPSPQQMLDDKKLTKESVLRVCGVVQKRPLGQENKEMKTGNVEVVADEVKVINACKPHIAITTDKFKKPNEELRMEFRYLDIRSDLMQRNLRMRSDVINAMRYFLCTLQNFVDIETPTLFRRTPGGATEFLVPSRFPGQFFCLPQSPQQFKQLLMVGGIERYMQVARCYRDESTKSDRQLEFTQLDLEMSFVHQDDVLDIVEQTIVHSWPHSRIHVACPFPRLTYAEAMMLYGTDKPDTRFDMQIQTVTDCLCNSGVRLLDVAMEAGPDSSIQALHVPQSSKHISRKKVDDFIDEVTSTTCPVIDIRVSDDGSWKSSLTKHIRPSCKQKLCDLLALQPSDLVILAAGQAYSPHEALGALRLKFAEALESQDVNIRAKDAYNFVWITDFPLFIPSKVQAGRLESAHHPFTAPRPEHEHLVYTQPEAAVSQHYDLVLNGQEIGGGSIRIHDSALQRYVLDHVLQEDSSDLDHLLEALQCGCPPHGGIALGLDRYLAILCGAKSIRDVIAFPKSNNGRDPMSKAPSAIPQSLLDMYHIQTKAP